MAQRATLSRVLSPRGRTGIVVAAWVVLLSPLARAEGPGGVPWRDTFESARDESLRTNRPLWVQFTGSWCLFCRKMDRESFAQADFAALGRTAFVPVKVHTDDREDLMERFRIEALPTTVVLDTSGRVLFRQEGYAPHDTLLGQLHGVSRQFQAQRPALALGGVDPVRLVETGRSEAGSDAVTAVHDGQTYRFVDAASRAAFQQAPDRFVPCGDGRCLVSLLEHGASVPGDPRFGVYYRDHLYLCQDEATRQAFARNPERFASVDLGQNGLCPHCLAQSNQNVRGEARFSSIYRGLRYLFPDETHRSAFRADPERYLR